MIIKDQSLVFFTLLMQAAVGISWGLYFLETGVFFERSAMEKMSAACWLLVFLLAVFSLAFSFFHLKVPLHAWRAMSNIRHSWLSREIFSVVVFSLSLLLISLTQILPGGSNSVFFLKWIALLSGPILIYCMGSTYRLKNVKFWDSAQTILAFSTSALIFGLMICNALLYFYVENLNDLYFNIIYFAGALTVLILLNLYFSILGFLRMISGTGESFSEIRKILVIRSWIGIAAVALSILVMFKGQSASLWLLWMLVAITVLSEFAGRVLFYSARVSYGVYLLKG